MSGQSVRTSVLWTYGEFINHVLSGLGIRPRRANRRACAAVTRFEGTGARFNPFAVIQPAPGATPYNTFDGDLHVWNYPDFETGVRATVELLGDEHFANVRRAMRVYPYRFGMLRAWDRAYTWVPGLDLNAKFPRAATLDDQLHTLLPNQ